MLLSLPSSDGWCTAQAQTPDGQSASPSGGRRCWPRHTCSSSWTSPGSGEEILESWSAHQILSRFCTLSGSSEKSDKHECQKFADLTWYSSLKTEITPGRFLYLMATWWLDALQCSPDSKWRRARFQPRKYAMLPTEKQGKIISIYFNSEPHSSAPGGIITPMCWKSFLEH